MMYHGNGKWNDIYSGESSDSLYYRGFVLEFEMDTIKPAATTTYRGHKYTFYNIPTTWTIAEEICESKNGYLVTISNQAENEAVTKLLKGTQSSWLGLCRNSEDEFEWIDKSALSYTNWTEGEPNNDGGLEYYGVIYSSGEWNDAYTGKWPSGNFYSYRGFILEESSEIPDNIIIVFIPPYTPEMNPIEQIWDEIREKGFRNECFPTLAKVMERLCDTINNLSPNRIPSITGRKWILSIDV